MKKIFFTLTLFILSGWAMLYGQGADTVTVRITGTVMSDIDETVSHVLIYLMDSTKTQLLKTETLDEKGRFVFENVLKGTYSITLERSERLIYSGETFEVSSDFVIPSIILKAETRQIEEVIVTKTKPFIERKDGMMILNMESNITSAGNSAFEVLEKAPGVHVDNNDNISLRGKSGVVVQIDGKTTPISGVQLATYLQSLPAENVDKIELITNPGAKYDASGTAIINIKMKKDRRSGTNGSISTAYGQGRYPKSNNSFALNHNYKKWNVFGNYGFAYREGFNELKLDRKFYNVGTFIGAYDQHNYLKMDFKSHVGRAGTDFSVNERHTLGIVVNAVSNKFNHTGRNLSDVFNANNTVYSRFESHNNSKDNWYNHAINMNHKFVIDTQGTEWITDLDYVRYGNATQQNFTTRYFDLQDEEARIPYLLHGDVEGLLTIYALKTDYVNTLDNKIKIETGAKSSYVKADNNLQFFDISLSEPVFDETKSNHFIYTENINAAYINGSKQFGKWSAYIGFRIENTNMTGKQLVDNTSFKDNHVQLFPIGSVNYTINSKNNLELNYNRRILRPSYSQLNPFKFFLDPTTYKEGNPYLKPQTTHAYEVTHTFNQKIYTTLSFARTKNNITEIIAPAEYDQQVTVQTYKNLQTADIYGLFLIMPIEVSTWWANSSNLNFYFGSYSGDVANTTIHNQGNFTYNINSQQTFKIGKGFAAELTGNYRAREVYAFMQVEPIWYINAGIQKRFRNSTLKLAVNDVFCTNKPIAETIFTDYEENFKVGRDTQVAVLSYTYSFGKNTNPQRRRGGAEDIKQRTIISS